MQIPREEMIHSLICCLTKQCGMCSYNEADSTCCKYVLVNEIIREVYQGENSTSIDY